MPGAAVGSSEDLLAELAGWVRLETPTTDAAAVNRLMDVAERELAQGTRLHSITRHLHGLFRAVPGARAFRRHLAGAASTAHADAEYLLAALALVADGVLDRSADLAHIAA